MSDGPGPRQFTAFTYGLGAIMGLPVASMIADPLAANMSTLPRFGLVVGFTIVLGAFGAAMGYVIDRWRQQGGGHG